MPKRRAHHEERSDDPQIEKRHADRGRKEIVEGADRRAAQRRRRTGAALQSRRILEKAGCTLDDVIKCNVWLADARDFWSFNKVYASYFPGVPPARSTVQSPLMIDAKIEIDCVAYRPL